MSTLFKSITQETEVFWSTKVWNWSSPPHIYWLKCAVHKKNNAVYMFDFSM